MIFSEIWDSLCIIHLYDFLNTNFILSLKYILKSQDDVLDISMISGDQPPC